MTDTISIEPLLHALRSYINTSEQIINELQLIKGFVEDCHQRSNAARPVGAMGGAAATVSILGLIFAPGVLAVPGVGATTAVLESPRAKKIIKKIEGCQADHERSVNQLKEETSKILQVVNQLVDQGIDFDVVIVSTFAFLGHIGQSGAGGIKTSDAVSEIQNSLQIGSIQNILAPTGISIGNRLAGGLDVYFPTIEATARMTPAQLRAYQSLAENPRMLLGKT